MESKAIGGETKWENNPGGEITGSRGENFKKKWGTKTREDFRDSLEFQRDSAEMLGEQIEAIQTERELERLTFREYKRGAEERQAQLKAKIEAYREVVRILGGER